MQAVGDLPNWRIKWDLYGPILVALFDGDAGRAVELADELTEREVNPNGKKTKEGRLTPAEEIERVRKLNVLKFLFESILIKTRINLINRQSIAFSR